MKKDTAYQSHIRRAVDLFVAEINHERVTQLAVRGRELRTLRIIIQNLWNNTNQDDLAYIGSQAQIMIQIIQPDDQSIDVSAFMRAVKALQYVAAEYTRVCQIEREEKVAEIRARVAKTNQAKIGPAFTK